MRCRSGCRRTAGWRPARMAIAREPAWESLPAESSARLRPTGCDDDTAVDGRARQVAATGQPDSCCSRAPGPAPDAGTTAGTDGGSRRSQCAWPCLFPTVPTVWQRLAIVAGDGFRKDSASCWPQQSAGHAVEFRHGAGRGDLQGRGQDGGQFVDPLGGQFALALGEAEYRPLLVQLKGERQAQRGGLGHLRTWKRLFAVDHQGSGREIAQALEVGMLQATDGAEEVAERQHVDKTQQVTDQRGGPADGRAVVLYHPQAHDLLARRAALVEHLE